MNGSSHFQMQHCIDKQHKILALLFSVFRPSDKMNNIVYNPVVEMGYRPLSKQTNLRTILPKLLIN